MKFDNNGYFIKKIARKGNGPGELHYPYSIAITDKYLAVDNNSKISYFDYRGHFIKNKNLYFNTAINNLNFNNNKYTCTSTKIEFGENKTSFMVKKILVLDTTFLNQKILDTKKIKYNLKGINKFNPLKLSTICRIKNDKIYIAQASNRNYSIDVYDISTVKKEMIIKKHYNKIKLKQSEQELLEQLICRINRTTTFKLNAKYANAINDLLIDNNGNIWVFPSIFRKKIADKYLYIDIFNKNGILFSQIKLDMGYDAFNFKNPFIKRKIYGNYLYILNSNKNSIEVYEINIK